MLVRKDVARLRTAVRAPCQPGQRRLHFAKEGPSRRRAVLSRLVELGVQARVYTSPNSVTASREACLDALIGDIGPAGAERLVIESRQTMDHLDDTVIKAALRRSGPASPDVPARHRVRGAAAVAAGCDRVGGRSRW